MIIRYLNFVPIFVGTNEDASLPLIGFLAILIICVFSMDILMLNMMRNYKSM